MGRGSGKEVYIMWVGGVRERITENRSAGLVVIFQLAR